MSTPQELDRALTDAVKWQETAEALKADLLTVEAQNVLQASRIRYLEGLLCDRCGGEGLLFNGADSDGIECDKCQGSGRPL